MGSLILCVGKKADRAFIFPESRMELYTIEEICYLFLTILIQ